MRRLPRRIGFERSIFRVGCLVALLAVGCSGRERSIEGGTAGILRFGEQTLGDVQLTLHERTANGFRRVGFAITAADGSFRLLQPGATGPLLLSDGRYHCTIETAGAPVQFPKSYLKPETSPVQVTFDKSFPDLAIDVPPLSKARTR